MLNQASVLLAVAPGSLAGSLLCVGGLLGLVIYLSRRLEHQARIAERRHRQLLELTEQLASQRHRQQAEHTSTLNQKIAAVAHELNNPLATILGYASLLLARPTLTVKDRNDLEIVARETERMVRVIRKFLASASAPEPVTPVSVLPAQENQSSARALVHPVNILVLDDEAALANLLGEAIEMMGFHSTVCTSPKEALNCADRQPITLVFSDFRMPELNGEQFYRQLVARHPELANRVVFLTGDAESPDSQTFFSRTGVPHLDKPCSLELLGQVIRERLPAAA